MKKLILFMGLSFLFYAQLGFCQTVKVESVRFEQQGDYIIIHYNLKGPSDKKCTVSVEASQDFGRTFTLEPIAVSGDVGKGVRTGLDRQIRWNLTRDFPSGLEGKGFVFAVDAKLEKSGSKWPWIALGTGVVGGVVYLLIPRPEKTATIAVQIDGNF
jgi:hypothetical protein